MKKNLLKAAVTTALVTAFAVPAFANPFVDVEQGHWAYDAVSVLAKDGVIEGYNDGTFKGDKTITRYEMAQMVAKAMHKDLNGNQKATVDKLSKEFASELNELGLQVEAVKAEQERVKVSGDARIRYAANDDNSDDTDFRARLSVDGKISDNMTLSTRISSGNIKYDGQADKVGLDTANVGFGLFGTETVIGRQDVAVGTGTILDDTINGVSTEIGNVKAFVGNQTDVNERLYGAEIKTGIFDGLNLGYIKADVKDGADKEFYGVNTKIALTKGVSVNAEYNKENNTGDDAVGYGVNFNKLGLSAMYKNVEAGAVTSYSAMSGDLNNVSFLNDGYKGMEYQFTKNVTDNAKFTLKYQDFKNQDGSKQEDRTAAYLNVNF